MKYMEDIKTIINIQTINFNTAASLLLNTSGGLRSFQTKFEHKLVLLLFAYFLSLWDVKVFFQFLE